MKTSKPYCILTFVIAATLLLLGCGGGGGGDVTADSTDKWTYMVYLGGDNDLSLFGIDDIGEMAQVGSSDNVNIVVQAEFSSFYTDGVMDTNTRRVLVQKGTAEDNFKASTDIGNVDMGSPAALTDFISWATTTYPADHYALVLWDHGSGWKELAAAAKSSLFRGAIVDETAGTFMSLPDLAAGVKNSGVHMDIINFDACLMAMYEVAYEFRGLADYMAFSEESEPGDGDPFDTILSDLVNDPDMSARELASVIVDRYDESYISYSQERDKLTTKSAVDMSRLDSLRTAVSALGQALMLDPDAADVAFAARYTSQEYSWPFYHDLYDLANEIVQNAPAGSARDAAANVITTLDAMVVNSLTNPDEAVSRNAGLAIYFPDASETSQDELEAYSQLGCSKTADGTWDEFIEWEIQEGGGGSGLFTMKIKWTTPSGDPCDANLDLVVMEPDEEIYAPPLGQTTPNGTFSSDSLVSGVSEEYYEANQGAQTGYYSFYALYRGDGSSCNQALMEAYFNDEYVGYAYMSSSSDTVSLGSIEVYPRAGTDSITRFEPELGDSAPSAIQKIKMKFDFE